MKKILSFLILLAMVFSVVACSDNPSDPIDDPVEEYGKIFYVSPDGDDSASGEQSSPWASLAGAVSNVREYKKSNGLPDKGIKVEFAAGVYKITEQVTFTPDDSGEDGKRIIYAAAKGADVCFDAGADLDPTAFKPVTDQSILQRLTDEAKKNVVCIDLAAAGCRNLDDSFEYSAGWTTPVSRQELYIDYEKATVARWPDEGYYLSEVVDETKDADSNKWTALKLPEGKAAVWADSDNIRCFGYSEYDYSGMYYWHAYADVEKDAVYVRTKFKDEKPFYVFNILEELDSPGEYYWDTASNILYYWPEKDISSAVISFSQMETLNSDSSESCMIFLNSDYVSFSGLTFQHCRNRVIANKNESTLAKNIVIKNCKFRAIGGGNAVFLFGDNTTVSDNEFYNIGGGAVMLRQHYSYFSSGESSNSVVKNNIIHDIAQVYPCYNAGIDCTNGRGFTISHNLIYESPHIAILFGRDSVVEYNDVHDVCTETGDAGAIYNGRIWQCNSTVRYNYIHNVIDRLNGGSPNGIYLDDQISDVEVYGNIVANIGGVGITMGGSSHISVHDNVLVSIGKEPIFNNDNGTNWDTEKPTYPAGVLWTELKKCSYMSDLWKFGGSTALIRIEKAEVFGTGLNPDSPGSQSYNYFADNIAYDTNPNGITWVDTQKYYDSNGFMVQASNESGDYCVIGNNILYDSPDIFIDFANGDYRLKDDSRVYREIVGFDKWDYSQIGIQK